MRVVSESKLHLRVLLQSLECATTVTVAPSECSRGRAYVSVSFQKVLVQICWPALPLQTWAFSAGSSLLSWFSTPLREHPPDVADKPSCAHSRCGEKSWKTSLGTNHVKFTKSCKRANRKRRPQIRNSLSTRTVDTEQLCQLQQLQTVIRRM